MAQSDRQATVEYSKSNICDRDRSIRYIIWCIRSYDVSDTELSQACDVLLQQADGLTDWHVVDFSDVSVELSAAWRAVEDIYICCRSQGVLAADDRALNRLVNAWLSAVFNKICCMVHGLNGGVASCCNCHWDYITSHLKIAYTKICTCCLLWLSNGDKLLFFYGFVFWYF